MFKNKPVEQRLSYFQIAGIHCYLFVGWDGEEGVKKSRKDTDQFSGYCAHNRVTFPTWHRPYMLLYDQVLYEIMLGLIEDWHKTLHLNPQEEDTWRGAASQFRLPY
ncbi:hypothetical protein ABVK25_007511 [Lepraria finkii]|uniref:Tyrosinase copper-binding domain-containing protein n=1 Tax=Lepraria finkii TaxID=1340010 RepID=A0ABR4B4U8_9LECA